MGVDPKAKELGLVDQPGLPEEVDGVVRVEGFLLNGQGQIGQLPHPRLHLFQQGLIQGECALGQDEQSAAEGVFHGNALHVFPARHIVKGFQHQKDRAALIGLNSGLVLGGNHFQRAVPVQNLVELAELSVPVNQQDVAGKPILEIRRDGAVGCSVGVGVFRAVHGDRKHFLFFHKIASFMCRYPLEKRAARYSNSLFLSYDIFLKNTRRIPRRIPFYKSKLPRFGRKSCVLRQSTRKATGVLFQLRRTAHLPAKTARPEERPLQLQDVRKGKVQLQKHSFLAAPTL